jgi:RNA polymerase sigma-70 factor (ECF subfamily)
MTVAISVAGTDAAVIRESRSDPARFSVLYDRYAEQLHRFAYRRVGPDAAEDVVAETFLAAFGHRERYDGSRPDARAWLFGILVRELAQHRRREQARDRALAKVPTDEATADSPDDRVAAEVGARALRGKLASVLAELGQGDRDVLLLVAWGDLGYAEVAEALEIPIGTVRSRLHRARARLKEALGGSDPTRETEDA